MATKNYNICAYNKTSDAGLDTSSFSVFMDGCNLACPYCMNGKLINGKHDFEQGIIKRLKKDVDDRKPEMIFISGGEPTQNPDDLFAAISLFKSWKCNVGLSTNGTNPDILEKIVSEYKKVDYVALDLKGGVIDYENLGDAEYFIKMLSSWLILRNEKKDRKKFDYEIRTTLYPPFITRVVINELARLFKPDEKWVFQQFRVVETMPYKNAKNIKPYSEEKVKGLVELVKKKVKNISVRYV